MTIDDAIKVLRDILNYVKPGDPPEEHIALTLGIQALKRLQDNRLDPEFDHWVPLPGETDE